MTMKELVRAAITGEMEDISSCEADAEAFAGSTEVAAFLNKLAAEKRERLSELRTVLREGTGFRQRKNEISKSVEAALRARATRAERASTVYSALQKVFNKPEYKEALRALSARELVILSEIKKLQAALKKD